MLLFKASVAAMSVLMGGDELTQQPAAESLIAFSDVISQVDYFPYQLKLVVHAPYGACGHGVECNFRNAYLVVIGDGEVPDYRVFDVGVAQHWEFVRWHDQPSAYFDDERDAFSVTLRRVLAPGERTDYVTATFSLYSESVDLVVEQTPE